MVDNRFGIFFKRCAFCIIGIVSVGKCVLAAQVKRVPFCQWAYDSVGNQFFPIRNTPDSLDAKTWDRGRIERLVGANRGQMLASLILPDMRVNVVPAHEDTQRSSSQSPRPPRRQENHDRPEERGYAERLFYSMHETPTLRERTLQRPRPPRRQENRDRPEERGYAERLFHSMRETPTSRERTFNEQSTSDKDEIISENINCGDRRVPSQIDAFNDLHYRADLSHIHDVLRYGR